LLAGLADPEDCFQPTFVENLWIVTAGNAGQSSVCNRTSAAALLDRLQHTFDYVIFDLPVVAELSTNFLLPSLVDGVMLVVQPGRTRTQSAHDAKNLLIRAGANLLGVICNKQHG
jgi:Mrp family chromosome partitioning ATPase